MKNLTFICLMLCSCGPDYLLSSGQYNVELAYTQSDWGVASGKISNVVWIIDTNNNEYTLNVATTSWVYAGAEEGNSVVFRHTQDYEDLKEGCDDYNYLELILYPSENKEQFTGTGYSELHLCNVRVCPPYDFRPECRETVEASIREYTDFVGELE